MDAKYDFSSGRMVKRSTGEAIPDDEPVFILRARDIKAPGAIRDYAASCNNPEHRMACEAVADAMLVWQSENEAREPGGA